MMTVIVSGGIGSGKSTVCRMLENEYGWPVYEADRRVKELYKEHPSLLDDIETALGMKLRDGDGVFIPKFLAERIFTDADALQIVEDFVFPILVEDFERWKLDHGDKEYVVLESATILEKPSLSYLGDHIIVVDAPVEERIERAALRDGTSPDAIAVRMASQRLMNEISDGMVPDCLDDVVMNDGDIADLAVKIRKCVENIKKTKML